MTTPVEVPPDDGALGNNPFGRVTRFLGKGQRGKTGGYPPI